MLFIEEFGGILVGFVDIFLFFVAFFGGVSSNSLFESLFVFVYFKELLLTDRTVSYKRDERGL